MKNNTYENIIDRLKKVNPEPDSGAELAQSILNNVEIIRRRRLSGIIIDMSEKHWAVFNNFRTLLAAAAVFLIGFFIYQQWELNDKLSRLETEMVTSKQVMDIGLTRNERIQNIFNEQIITKTKLDNKLQESDVVMVNRKSLNYILEAIRTLEKENKNYREIFQKYYTDSISKKH